MASLNITEYGLAKVVGGGRAPLAKEPAIVSQTVPFTTPAASAAFAAGTAVVRLVSDTACVVRFGVDPVAAAGDELILANLPEWREVNPGDKISVYDGTSV